MEPVRSESAKYQIADSDGRFVVVDLPLDTDIYEAILTYINRNPNLFLDVKEIDIRPH